MAGSTLARSATRLVISHNNVRWRWIRTGSDIADRPARRIDNRTHDSLFTNNRVALGPRWERGDRWLAAWKPFGSPAGPSCAPRSRGARHHPRWAAFPPTTPASP